MKSIGSYLKSARKAKKISLVELEEETKIKKEFIDAIEKENWHRLPEFPVVRGFVKNIATILELDREKSVALLRRDYPPQKPPVSPEPDLKVGFRWGPRITFLLGVLSVILLIVSYLLYQYFSFNRPPELTVTAPVFGSTVSEGDVEVIGVTDPQASVRVNNQPAIVNEDGNFETIIEVTKDTNIISIQAVSRSNKETTVEIPITVE